VPPPYGESFSKETLIRSASSKAFAATTEARIGGYNTCCNPTVVCLFNTLICTGPDIDPLRDGFQATSLNQDEVERLLDACIKHNDHWSGFKVAAMPPPYGAARNCNGLQRCCTAVQQMCSVNLQSEQTCAHEQCVAFAR